MWEKALKNYAEQCREDIYRHWFETFCPEGRAPLPGEVWRSPGHARTLTRIAESGAEDFYRGELAERIDAFSVESKGWLRESDLAAYRPEWVEPLSVNYRGYDVWEIPPNGHGIAALMALNLLKGFGLPDERETAEVYHLQIEAMKVAYADVLAYVADPRFMSCTARDLLSEGYADESTKIGRASCRERV